MLERQFFSSSFIHGTTVAPLRQVATGQSQSLFENRVDIDAIETLEFCWTGTPETGIAMNDVLNHLHMFAHRGGPRGRCRTEENDGGSVQRSGNVG
jgi:hypothetical protein